MEGMFCWWRRKEIAVFATVKFWYTISSHSVAAVIYGRWTGKEMWGKWRLQQSCGSLSSSSSYFVRTCRIFTEEFLSSGPTHWSIRIPSLYSPLRRPSNVSTENSGGFQSGWVTGQPPSDSKTVRRGASPSLRIWAARKKHTLKDGTRDRKIGKLGIKYYLCYFVQRLFQCKSNRYYVFWVCICSLEFAQ